MNRRTHHIVVRLLLLLLLGMAAQAWAGPVTADQARQSASKFLNKRVAKRARAAAPAAKALKMAAAGKNDSYYIFNVGEGGGYVVVSGDDATEEVLGYSDTGSINPDSMPCGMRMLLNSYADQIQYLRANGITREQNTSARKAPAITSFHVEEGRLAKYDQGEPYNNLCPRLGISDLWERCATGCAATALSELMYFYRWPSHTTSDIPGYTTTTKQFTIDAIPANTAIDWENIIRQYNEYYPEESYQKRHPLWETDEQADAIANFMKMAGAAVHMDYDKSSNAYNVNIPFALKKYFGYETAKLYFRSSYTDEEWDNMLSDELVSNVPIIYYGINDKNEGHFFMLEGYMYENGFYYYNVNFGADGRKDNYFILNVVEGDFDFTNNQCAILDVKPQSVLVPVDIPLRLSTRGFGHTGRYLYSYSQSSNQFEDVKLWAKLRNQTPIDTYFDHGFRFVPFDNVNQTTKDIIISENMWMQSMGKNGQNGKDTDEDAGYQDGVEYSFTVGNDIPDGEYEINCISKETGTNTWYDNEYNNTVNVVICKGKLAFPSFDNDAALLSLFSFTQTSEVPLRVGQPSEFCYMIENVVNNNVGLYDGVIIGEAVWTDGGVEKSMPIFIDEMQVLPNGGRSNMMGFTYTPPIAGEQNIVFYNKQWEEIGSLTLTALSATQSLDLLEVTSVTLKDGDNDAGIIDGTTLRGAITMLNHDGIAKKSQITVRLTDSETQAVKSKTLSVNIPAGQSATYDFSFGNLTPNHHYVVTACYASGEEFYRSAALLCSTDGLGEVEDGNEELTQYEYWFDDDVNNRRTVTMGSNNAVVRASIDTDGLTAGLHRFNFRVKRADGMYSSVSTTTFFNLKAESEGRIVYWFDNNSHLSASTPIADTEDEQQVALDLADMKKFPLGLHRLNMRVATPGKSLSNVYTAMVMKMASGEADQLEYWIDEDYDNHRRVAGQKASSSDGYIFRTPIDFVGMEPGFHRLYYRATSTNGITNTAVGMAPVMVMGNECTTLEYWLDGKYDNRRRVTGHEASSGGGYIFTNALDFADMPVGFHRLYYRATNESGITNTAIGMTPVMLMGTECKELEYWIDEDYDNRKRVAGHLSSADDGVIFTTPIDFAGMEPGFHRFYYRATSENGITSTAVGMEPVMVMADDYTTLEYWIDGDYDNRRTLTGNSEETGGNAWVETIDLGNVPSGVHRLYCRATSASGTANSAVTMTPIMVKSMYDFDQISAKVVRYSVAVDNGEPMVLDVLNPAKEKVLNYTLDARKLSQGNHTVTTHVWNSAYAGVVDKSTVKVVAETKPTITLTATEKDGLVKLQFNSIPNDVGYRFVRTDKSSGAKAKPDGKQVSSYPNDIVYIDNPAAGTYTYMAQSNYIASDGTRKTVNSNEVTVTVAEPQTEVVAAQEFGYVTGRIVCDQNTPTYGLKVKFSDGVTVNAQGAMFNRVRIPAGTQLTLAVEGDDAHEYESCEVTVEAGLNAVTIRGTQRPEYQQNNLLSDLVMASALEWDLDGARATVDVRNLSHEQVWTGLVRIKVIEKKKADKAKEDVADMSYETKNLYTASSYTLRVEPNGKQQADISFNGNSLLGMLRKLKDDTDFYVYLESVGKWENSVYDEETKPVATVDKEGMSENPLVATMKAAEQYSQKWDKEAQEDFSYLMLGLASITPGLDDMVGDFSRYEYEEKMIEFAKAYTHKTNAKEAVNALLEIVNGETSALETLSDLNKIHLASTGVGIIQTLKDIALPQSSILQKFRKDVIITTENINDATSMLGTVSDLAKAVVSRDKFEQMMSCASVLYSITAVGEVPLASMMYYYMEAGKQFINAAKEIQRLVHEAYLPDRLHANKSRVTPENGSYNTTCDFKLVVKTDGYFGGSKVDFTKDKYRRQIVDIVVKATNTTVLTTYRFDLKFQKDGIMLKLKDSNSAECPFGVKPVYNDGGDTGLKQFYMEIHWANDRITYVPFLQGVNGVDIEAGSPGPLFENDAKPSLYTVTLTTKSGKDKMGDEIYIGQ